MLEVVKQLLEGSFDAAVILDSDRRILYFNRAYQTASGTRGRQLSRRVEEGAHCYDLFPLEICEKACVGCKAADVGRALRVDEIKALRSEGEERTFIVTAVPLDGGYIVETYRDVTADVRIQKRLKILLERERHAKAILEEEIDKQTKELRQAHAQLVHQEKMSSLGRLVAGIAHELNNPINFVYGNVDFLAQYMEDLLSVVKLVDESHGLSPELRDELARAKEDIEYDFLVEDLRKLISSIRSGAERTASIVRDLKTFSRAGDGEIHEADVTAAIETTLTLIAPLLKNRIKVERTYAPGLPKLVCNAGHLSQVFMNILTNAAQAIAEEGTIWVVVEPVPDKDSIRVEISDSGAGIEPEILEKIMDPFFTTKEVGEGTGLGLSISESIVRAHGGTLACKSRPGEGATFTLVLPIRAPETARAGLLGAQRGRAEPQDPVASAAEDAAGK